MKCKNDTLNYLTAGVKGESSTVNTIAKWASCCQTSNSKFTLCHSSAVFIITSPSCYMSINSVEGSAHSSIIFSSFPEATIIYLNTKINYHCILNLLRKKYKNIFSYFVVWEL